MGSALFMVVLGLTVLVGWFSHTAALVQFLPRLPPMTRNAAASFVLCGLALMMAARRSARWLVAVCAGIVSVLSFLTLGEYIFGVNAGIDELLGPAYVSARLSSRGRMWPAAAICFAFGSTGLLLAPRVPTKRSALWLGLNGSIVAAVGMATSMDFALGSSYVIGWGHVTRAPFQTAVGLWILGLGMLALAWRAEAEPSGTPRWLPISVMIGVATSNLGLWQALIAAGNAPFAPLPVVVLGGGCLMAPILGLTVYLAQRAHTQAADLRRNEAFLEKVQQLSSTGGFYWWPETGKVYWSEQVYRIFELDPAVPLTTALRQSRIHPDDLPAHQESIQRAIRDARYFEYEVRLLMPDNSVKYVHSLARPTRDAEGNLLYVGAVQDITQRRLSEIALARVHSELSHIARVTTLGTLTASIAHEVNQPLSGIITNASTCLRMLNADPPNVDGARETAKRTIRDGNRASDVIKRLRALFSKKSVALESSDLNEATREVIALFLNDLQRNQVTLHLELAENLPAVRGDRVELQQVILNLLRNASDAMTDVHDRQRVLLVKTERDAGDVRVTVRDAGVGLDHQSLERVFDPFYTTKTGGMGIGLSVSRSIIESHHGRLWAAPNDGPGATFSFSIPCEPEIVTRA
jgi:PAS domain S-box-containing protein